MTKSALLTRLTREAREIAGPSVGPSVGLSAGRKSEGVNIADVRRVVEKALTRREQGRRAFLRCHPTAHSIDAELTTIQKDHGKKVGAVEIRGTCFSFEEYRSGYYTDWHDFMRGTDRILNLPGDDTDWEFYSNLCRGAIETHRKIEEARRENLEAQRAAVLVLSAGGAGSEAWKLGQKMCLVASLDPEEEITRGIEILTQTKLGPRGNCDYRCYQALPEFRPIP